MFGIRRRNAFSPAEPGTVNLSQEDYGLLLGIYEQQLGTREDAMALSKQVQDLLDRSKQESDIIKSMAGSMKALLQQNADMQEKLDRVPVKPEPAMSQEDKDALTEMASDMDTAILTAQQAIPQNTPQASGAGNTGVASASQGGSPGLSDQAQSGGSSAGMSSSDSPPATPPQPTDTTNPAPGSAPSDSKTAVEGTATPADQSAPAAAPDAGSSDSQHAQDAQAAQQAKPIAGTGGQ